MTPTTSLLDDLLADLAAEGDRLRDAVAGLDESEDAADGGWHTPTPAAGWDVATQVAHLAWTDQAATAAATDKEAWDALVLQALGDPDGFVDAEAHRLARLAPDELLARWDRGRATLAAALRAHPAGQKMPWFGPPMAPASMATARFMETWAHALDVYDALGGRPEPTDRIRHVAHLGVRTRGFAFGAHGLEPPAEELRVELVAPSGRVVDLGARGCGPAGHRPGVRLLPAGHPARPPRRHRPGRHRTRRRPLARRRPGVRRPAR